MKSKATAATARPHVRHRFPGLESGLLFAVLLWSSVASAQNTAPTISQITNRVFGQNLVSPAVPFTVGDAETPAGGLTVTAVSGNQGVIADGGLALATQGAGQWTLTLTPVPDQWGQATITVTVSDGELLTSTNFVAKVDATPVISPVPLPDVVVGENTPSAPIPFTIGDVDTFVFDLVVRATSTNQALVPDANLKVTEDGSDLYKRYLTITPAPGQRGVTKINLSVLDGHTTNTTTLAVAVNAYPTVSTIADQVVPENGVTGPIAFTVGDPDTPVGNLVVSAVSSNRMLVPDASVVTGGAGADRTVSVTPAVNFAGQAQITVAVSDGQLTTRTNFLVTVTPSGPTTTEGLVRLANTNGVADAVAALTVTNGVLMAEQSSSVDNSFLRNAWYATGGVRTAGYIVSADFLPGENYPNSQRGGVIGWLDLRPGKGIALSVRPGSPDGHFQVSVIDFTAASVAAVESFDGLFETNGTAADLGSARAELGAYDPSTFATFRLEIAPPSAADRARTNATAHLFASVIQRGTNVASLELLTNLPVPGSGNHAAGFFAGQYDFQDGSVLRPIGYLDNLRVMEPALTIQRGAGEVTVSWPLTFRGYGLETNSAVTGGTWAPIPLSGPNSVAVPGSEAARFFRLGPP